MAISEVQQVLIPRALSFIFMEGAWPLHIFDLRSLYLMGRRGVKMQLNCCWCRWFFCFVFWWHQERNWGCHSYLKLLNSSGGWEQYVCEGSVNSWQRCSQDGDQQSLQQPKKAVKIHVLGYTCFLNIPFLGVRTCLCLKEKMSKHCWLAFPMLHTSQDIM